MNSAFGMWRLCSQYAACAARVGLHPGHVAFSPDGKLMALEMAPAVIHLIDAATFRTIAKLEDPHGDRSRLARLHARWHATGGRHQARHGDPHLGSAGHPRAAQRNEPGLGLAGVSQANPITGSAPEKYTVDVVLEDASNTKSTLQDL